MNFRTCKAAFPYTIPVLTGYIFLGMAYGILMTSKGFGVLWTFLVSTFVYAGSLQYVGITLFVSAFNPLGAFLLSLMVNARHLFYGISMLEKYKGTGKIKPLLIFWLTDETFSINCSVKIPEHTDKAAFYGWISALNYLYWVGGSVLGAIAGSFISFNTKGLDFALTALFTVIFVSQWKEQKRHISALIGIFSSVACLVLFGSDQFIIPALIAILILLLLFRPHISDPDQEVCK